MTEMWERRSSRPAQHLRSVPLTVPGPTAPPGASVHTNVPDRGKLTARRTGRGRGHGTYDAPDNLRGVVREARVNYGTDTGNATRTARATACDQRLRALLGAEKVLDHHIAIGLARIWDRQHYKTLGHARATDYAQERLGMKSGRARWLAQLGRAMQENAHLKQALATGRLNASQAILLAPCLATCSSTEQVAWIDRAAPLKVSDLRTLLQAERSKETPEGKGAAGGGSHPTDAPSDNNGDTNFVSVDDLKNGLQPGVNVLDPDAPVEGEWFRISAPARTGELWSLTTNMARKVAGHQLASHGCAEVIAAEYLSFAGDESPDETGRYELEHRRKRCADAFASLLQRGRRASDETLESLLTQLPPGVDYELINLPKDRQLSSLGDANRSGLRGEAADGKPPNQVVAGTRPQSPPDAALLEASQDPEIEAECARVESANDAWELHAAVACLEDRRRRLRLDIGKQLRTLERCWGWQALGHDSLARYCTDRLGISKRRASDLIRVFCRLKRLKRLRRAYLAGIIHYSKVRSLLRVAHPSTESAWVAWARYRSCREVDATTEYAQLYIPNKMDAATWAGIVPTFAMAPAPDSAPLTGAPTTFATGRSTTQGEPSNKPAVGCPLPPLSQRSGPRIAGHTDLIVEKPEVLSTCIRFWAPAAEAQVFRRALRRCRALNERYAGDQPDWAYLEIILTHFMLAHDNPDTRKSMRRHRIIARDDFRCGIPTCTSRANLHAHHVWWRSNGGPDNAWNLLTLCVAHHQMVHDGTIEVGGWAPWAIIIRLGVHPRSNRADLCFRNGLQTTDETAREWMARWRRWRRARTRHANQLASETAAATAAAPTMA